MTYLEFLADAIEKLHNCRARYFGRMPVSERSDGKIVWEGTVEVFTLSRHPKTKWCYAWGFEDDDGQMKAIAVLGVPPITSAAKAVQAYVVSTFKENQKIRTPATAEGH